MAGNQSEQKSILTLVAQANRLCGRIKKKPLSDPSGFFSSWFLLFTSFFTGTEQGDAVSAWRIRADKTVVVQRA
jgi:hypothetical protein